MADDFKDISHLYKVTPSAKTIIDGEDLVETKQKSKAYAWCDVLQSVTGLILGLFLFCHMGFTSSILLGKDTFWSLDFFDRPATSLTVSITSGCTPYSSA